MAQSSDKRRGSRIRTRFETAYSVGREEGTGILANISYSGALLMETSLQARLGSKVRVRVVMSEPFEVAGKVVRHVEGGFAIEYADVSPELRRLIDDAGGGGWRAAGCTADQVAAVVGICSLSGLQSYP
jgi:hypothetical protein